MTDITYATVLELGAKFTHDQELIEAITRLAKPENIPEMIMGCQRVAETYLSDLIRSGKTTSSINYEDAKKLFLEKLQIHWDHHLGNEFPKPVEKDNEND